MSPKLKYILATIIYGTIGFILRFINIPSEIVVLVRGSVGSLFIFTFVLLSKNKLNVEAIKGNLKFLILSGMFLGMNWVFLFAAYLKTTVAIASLFNYMAPIILVCLAPLLYNEKLTIHKALCVIGAFIGIILVSGVFESNLEFNTVGYLLSFAACLCFVGLVICNRKLNDIGVYEKVIIQLATSALTVLPYVLFKNIGTNIIFDIKSIILTLILGFVHTGLAYCLYFGSINDLEVNEIAIFGYIEPIVSILTSALILNEKMSLLGAIGSILVLGSAVISELKTKV